MSGGGAGTTRYNPSGVYYRDASGRMVPYDEKTYGQSDSYSGNPFDLINAVVGTLRGTTPAKPVLYSMNSQGYWAPFTGNRLDAANMRANMRAGNHQDIGTSANTKYAENMAKYAQQLQQLQSANAQTPTANPIMDAFAAGLARSPYGGTFGSQFTTPYNATQVYDVPQTGTASTDKPPAR